MRQLTKLLCACVLLIASSVSALAASLNLYEEPKESAKVIGSISLDNGIVPIFTPKNSEWMKVADPRNGNVGWIQTNKLTGKTTHFTQRIISTGNQPQSYQVIQYSGMPATIQSLTPEQSKALLEKIQAQQKAISENTKRMIDEIWKNVPVIMPIIITPVPQEPAKTK